MSSDFSSDSSAADSESGESCSDLEDRLDEVHRRELPKASVAAPNLAPPLSPLDTSAADKSSLRDASEEQLWAWFWKSLPSSCQQYRAALEKDGFDNVRSMTLLTGDDFKRLGIEAQGHRAQISHGAKQVFNMGK